MPPDCVLAVDLPEAMLQQPVEVLREIGVRVGGIEWLAIDGIRLPSQTSQPGCQKSIYDLFV